MPTTHPELHRLLAYAHQLRSEHEKRLASYHWQKYIDPLAPIPIPDKPHGLHLFAIGDYHGFCDSLGIAHSPAGALCAESACPCRNQSGG